MAAARCAVVERCVAVERIVVAVRLTKSTSGTEVTWNATGWRKEKRARDQYRFSESRYAQSERTSEDITKITYSRRASCNDNKLVQADNREQSWRAADFICCGGRQAIKSSGRMNE